MAASVVEIFNLALSNIGSTQQVVSTADTSKGAVQCGLWWPKARDLVLRAGPWPFAINTVVLQPIATALYQPVDYAYAYAYPDDCLKALEIFSPAGRQPPPRGRIPFTERALPPAPGKAGFIKMILTDMPPMAAMSGAGVGFDQINTLSPTTPLPTLRYITQVVDVTMFPPDVDVAMAWQLAAFIAMPMAQAKNLKADAEKMAVATRQIAMANAFNEGQMDPPEQGEPQDVRS